MNTANVPKVSVIIPSYNHGKYIGDSIKSVLEQTYSDYEIIISDDASTDNTMDIISKIIDSRIRVHRFSSNQGAAINTNYCISESKGKYIAVLNSDDFWQPNKLEKQVDYLDNYPEVGAIFTNANFVNDLGKILTKQECKWFDIFEQPNLSQGEWLRKLFFEQNCLCHPSVLIRKDIYNIVGYYKLGLRQLPDFDMWIEVLKRASIYVIKEKLVNFRILIYGENTSADTRRNHIRTMNEIYFIMRKYFSDMPLDVFMRGFKNDFRRADLENTEMQECEKAFLYFKGFNKWKPAYRLIGIEKLFSILQNTTGCDILKNFYNFTEKDFFELMESELSASSFEEETLAVTETDIFRIKIKNIAKRYPFMYRMLKKLFGKQNRK